MDEYVRQHTLFFFSQAKQDYSDYLDSSLAPMFISPCSVVVRAAKLMDIDYRCGPGISAMRVLCTSSLAELLHLAFSSFNSSFTNQNSPWHKGSQT